MTRDFTSFSKVFQSYEADGRVIMNGCVQWNPLLRWKRLPPEEDLSPGLPESRLYLP